MSNCRIGTWVGRINWPPLPWALLALTLVVTGCPHNDFLVQLTPQGDRLERTLTFYCADGVNTNTGIPSYQSFNAEELAAISNRYPAGSVTHDGRRYTAHGEFSQDLPADVGGTGTYDHFPTSLGDAAVYTERFRGNDDFAGLAQRHFQAADRLADLMIGWSRQELWREPGYGRLRHFLDVEFRNDLKNISAYWAAGQLAEAYKTNASEEFVVRFGQYLWERGYFKTEEIPGLFAAFNSSDPHPLLARIQRLVAVKMGVPETDPLPPALAFLNSPDAMEDSLGNYLAGTKLYQAKLDHWRQVVKQKRSTKRPEPDEVMQDALGDMLELDLFGHADHLAVRLSLPLPPLHTNGRWDASLHQVLWETEIAARTNAAQIPYTCYASWAQPDPSFQTNHFGRTVLDGDNLTQYCLWRNSLNPLQSAEWDTFVAQLKPDAGLTARLDAFRFQGEPVVSSTNGEQNAFSPSAYPRQLLTAALKE